MGRLKELFCWKALENLWTPEKTSGTAEGTNKLQEIASSCLQLHYMTYIKMCQIDLLYAYYHKVDSWHLIHIYIVESQQSWGLGADVSGAWTAMVATLAIVWGSCVRCLGIHDEVPAQKRKTYYYEKHGFILCMVWIYLVFIILWVFIPNKA